MVMVHTVQEPSEQITMALLLVSTCGVLKCSATLTIEVMPTKVCKLIEILHNLLMHIA